MRISRNIVIAVAIGLSESITRDPAGSRRLTRTIRSA